MKYAKTDPNNTVAKYEILFIIFCKIGISEGPPRMKLAIVTNKFYDLSDWFEGLLLDDLGLCAKQITKRMANINMDRFIC